MAKKKAEAKAQPKRYGTLIRVSDEFADALRKAVASEGVTTAEFATTVLLPVVKKRYRDAIIKEARQLEGESK